MDSSGFKKEGFPEPLFKDAEITENEINHKRRKRTF